MRRRALGVSILVAALGLAATSGARAATLDPKTAEADVKRAREEGINAFCTKPERPLTPHARALCPMAKDIEGCQGLVDACSDQPPAIPEKEKVGDGLLRRLMTLFAGGAQLAIWLIVLAAVVAIAFPIVQAIRKRRKDLTVADPPPELAVVEPVRAEIEAPIPLTDAELLLRRAEEQAHRGELDRAALTFLSAALRALDHRGAIRLAKHRTNGEYVRACKEADARAALREIVREVERVQFGREAPSAEAVSRVAGRAAALVRMAPTLLLAIALGLGAAACQSKGAGPLLRSADPAGDEVLTELLKRQGMSVSRVGGSLATLPLPRPDVPAPTVLIDVERVALEDETRAHLARWVEAGGILVLAGRPSQWPPPFGAKSATATSTELSFASKSDDEDEDEATSAFDHGWLARPSALDWKEGKWKVGWLEGGATYAAIAVVGKGMVLGLANDDLLTNAVLARHGNPTAIVALLGLVERGKEIRIAKPEDGISPPQNPITALRHAGLGLGLWHALAAVLVAFLAVGVRLGRPKPTPPPHRRAFTEHVIATGALYARTRIAKHALAAYTRFADERLRAKMPRGMTDPAAYLASRANADPASSAELWARACAARTTDPPRGDELVTLRKLSQLFTAATRAG